MGPCVVRPTIKRGTTTLVFKPKPIRSIGCLKAVWIISDISLRILSTLDILETLVPRHVYLLMDSWEVCFTKFYSAICE